MFHNKYYVNQSSKAKLAFDLNYLSLLLTKILTLVRTYRVKSAYEQLVEASRMFLSVFIASSGAYKLDVEEVTRFCLTLFNIV